MTDKLSPVHPGKVLLDKFIRPMGLSQNYLAVDIGVDARRINEIVLGKRSALLPQILHCAPHAFLAIHPKSGWGCSRNTISTLLRINLTNE